MLHYLIFSINKATESLQSEGLPKSIMIDCNHANSGKDPSRQELVLRNIVLQIKDGNKFKDASYSPFVFAKLYFNC